MQNPRLPKGQQTKATLIDAARRLAEQVGLEGLSIGAVAEVAGMSKSGVFAHFGSRAMTAPAPCARRWSNPRSCGCRPFAAPSPAPCTKGT